MRALWFSTHATNYSDKSVAAYGGEGWIGALQDALTTADNIELGLGFTYPLKADLIKRGKVTYYPIFAKPKAALQKLLHYWYRYKKEKSTLLLSDLLDVIQDFKPDIIQIFGIESPFACILGQTDVPVVVHLQGFLNPYYYHYYPPGMNRYTFLLESFSTDEWIKRNGYNFAANRMLIRSRQERDYFQQLQFGMGRTEWDYHIACLLAPQSQYFVCGEILRDEFYQVQPWHIPPLDKQVISSTISQTIYKGLDMILQTAKLLKKLTGLNYEWRVIGVSADSKFVRFFEKHCKIKSTDVNVKYMGVCSAVQICENLLESHVYVHPSYIDNSPNSLCEAQFVGLPVIGTYVGGIPSLITHKKTGLLVPANASYELCYWLQYLYSNPEMMMKLGATARQEALERHSKEKIVSDVLNAYKKIGVV